MMEEIRMTKNQMYFIGFTFENQILPKPAIVAYWANDLLASFIRDILLDLLIYDIWKESMI